MLAREPGGRSLVVDYKTDRLDGTDPRTAARGYEIQRLIYAIAALRAGADEVEIAHCFLEQPDTPVIVGFEAERLPELDASLAVARGRHRRRSVRGLAGAAPRALRRLSGRGRALLVAAVDDSARGRRHAVLGRQGAGAGGYGSPPVVADGSNSTST